MSIFCITKSGKRKGDGFEGSLPPHTIVQADTSFKAFGLVKNSQLTKWQS